MPASSRSAASLSRYFSCQAVLALLLVALTGCASIDSAPPRFGTEANALKAVDAYFDGTLRRYLAAQPQKQKEIRNGFIETRAALIDQGYAGFRQTLYTQRVGMNVGVDLATLGLNAVGAVTGSAPAKTGLHALSGGLIGSKASIDKNVFFDRTMPALVAQMEAQRSALRLRMMGGMMVDTSRYPLMQARADLEEYYAAGTMVGAIGSITTQAMVEQKGQTDELQRRLPSQDEIVSKLDELKFDVLEAVNDEPGRQLSDCWMAKNLKAQAANRAAIRAWWKAAQVELDPDDEFDFFDAPEWAAKRKDASADTGLAAQLKGCSVAAK